ncbi:hypothetical protein ACFQU2_24475 [Siccirubricoccus deserti]
MPTAFGGAAAGIAGLAAGFASVGLAGAGWVAADLTGMGLSDAGFAAAGDAGAALSAAGFTDAGLAAAAPGFGAASCGVAGFTGAAFAAGGCGAADFGGWAFGAAVFGARIFGLAGLEAAGFTAGFVTPALVVPGFAADLAAGAAVRRCGATCLALAAGREGAWALPETGRFVFEPLARAGAFMPDNSPAALPERGRHCILRASTLQPDQLSAKDASGSLVLPLRRHGAAGGNQPAPASPAIGLKA